MRSYQGESHTIRVTLKDSGGTVIAPSLSTITNIECRLVNRISGEVAIKWSRIAQTGFNTLSVLDSKCVLFCNESILKKKHAGNYDIEVKIITANTNMPGGDVQIEKAALLNLNPANNG